jgi:hypothetical protein
VCRRYAAEEKALILETVEQAQGRGGQAVTSILSQLGFSRAIYGRRPGTPYRWQERAQSGQSPQETCGLTDQVVVPQRQAWPPTPDEVAAVCDFALAHPATDSKRLTWLMVDQDIAFLRPYQVCRILKGQDLLARHPQPLPDALKRPPAPDHPDQVWHTDLRHCHWRCTCTSGRVGTI